ARKRRSVVAPTNTSPPAVTVGPALPLLPVSCLPSGSASVSPSGVSHAISPVLALTATSRPHGGRWHGRLAGVRPAGAVYGVRLAREMGERPPGGILVRRAEGEIRAGPVDAPAAYGVFVPATPLP